jgi:Putative zinc-finger
MNCTDCKELLTVFIDGELDEASAVGVRAHLAGCHACRLVCEDMTSILCAVTDGSPDELVPPNSKALWCRINNIIESESKPKPARFAEEPRRGWRVTFGQLAAALVCIAVISSLLTVVAIRNYTQPADGDFVTRSAASQTTFEKLLSRVGLMDSPQQARDRRLKEQQAAIEYWTARVEARRLQWDRATRDAFDRNLQVIDESVSEYTTILQRDPEDELSGEMLDSVLTEKMNLLRDFADL